MAMNCVIFWKPRCGDWSTPSRQPTQLSPQAEAVAVAERAGWDRGEMMASTKPILSDAEIGNLHESIGWLVRRRSQLARSNDEQHAAFAAQLAEFDTRLKVVEKIVYNIADALKLAVAEEKQDAKRDG